jgi:hypothetical protein
MKCFSRLTSLVFVVSVACLSALPVSAQHKAEKLSKAQVVSLVATARTKADHLRLASYYHGKAADYLADSKEHEDLAAAYKKNTMTANMKFKTGTVDHCDYFAQSFKEDSIKMDELAKMHEAMATDTK